MQPLCLIIPSLPIDWKMWKPNTRVNVGEWVFDEGACDGETCSCKQPHFGRISFSLLSACIFLLDQRTVRKELRERLECHSEGPFMKSKQIEMMSRYVFTISQSWHRLQSHRPFRYHDAPSLKGTAEWCHNMRTCMVSKCSWNAIRIVSRACFCGLFFSLHCCGLVQYWSADDNMSAFACLQYLGANQVAQSWASSWDHLLQLCHQASKWRAFSCLYQRLLRMRKNQ